MIFEDIVVLVSVVYCLTVRDFFGCCDFLIIFGVLDMIVFLEKWGFWLVEYLIKFLNFLGGLCNSL